MTEAQLWSSNNATVDYYADDILREKDKAPIPTDNRKRQETPQIKTSENTSITKRLRTDLGRSVGVTTVIQLVWLNRFKGSKHSH